MRRTNTRAEDLQRRYYQSTAESYDASHVHEDDEHQQALRYIALMLPGLGARTALDTGCGTGRAIRFLRQHCPEVHVRGNDPSGDLLRIARDWHGIPAEDLIQADTLALPDDAGSFDVVMSFAVLHHVPRPGAIVDKMVRLASKAIFISDGNYLGQGPWPKRLMKLALTKIGLWRPVKYMVQGFKPYIQSEGDGISYSYSAFSDLPILAARCRQVWAVPLGPGCNGAAGWPELASSNVLLCGLK